jgi:hypothetical protein
MILVAAFAGWLSIGPGYLANLLRGCREIYDLTLQLAGLVPWATSNPRWMAWRYLHAAIHNVLSPWPFLFGYLVLAVLILGFRRPRPSWRQLARRSGFGGCLLLFIYAFVRLDLWWLGGENLPFVADAVFAGILLWGVLGRRPWHAEPTWLDRLGRGVVIFWILFLSIRAADHTLFGCEV